MSTSAAQYPGDFVPGRSQAARQAAGRLGAPALPEWKRFKRLKKITATAPDDAGVLVEVVAACAQVRANLEGVEAEALQHLLRLPSRSGWEEELATRLRLSTRAVQNALDRAAALDDYLEVHFALLGGDIDLPKARVLIEAVRTLPVGPARAIHRALLPRASWLTVGQLRSRLRAAVLAVDADQAQQRHDQAVRDRYVRAEPTDDGMAYLTFYLPATDAAAAMSVLDALAVKDGPDDERGIAARRVDAFTAIVHQILTRGTTPDGEPVPSQQGQRPQIVFTVAQSTLDGQDDAPGYLAGYGPLAADIIRRLATLFGTDQNGVGPGATTRDVRTDPLDGTARPPARTAPAPPEEATSREERGTSPGREPGPAAALAALGILASDSYQPGAALREFIITRDVTCRFPTCRQPGRRCQIDHIIPFDPGQPAWAQTHQGNLHLLCARHHGLKTAGTWTVTRDEITGDTCWTSPLGYTYTRPPEVIDPAYGLPALHRHLDDMRAQHADQDHLWNRPAPLAPGVLDEAEYARLMCTNPAHAPAGRCDCAERAEDITTILARLQPSRHEDQPAGESGTPAPPNRPGDPGDPAKHPPGRAPGDLPTSTDPPPF